MARRILALALGLAAVLAAEGCRHRKGSETREAYPVYTPVVVSGGSCGCPCGGPMIGGGSYYGGDGHHGGPGCGCGGP